MRRILVFGLLLGLVVLTALLAHYGLADIAHAGEALGWDGFAIVIAMHLLLIAWMGGAWWLLALGRPDARPWRFAWGRLMRESASEALPFSQVGGFVIGARAVTLAAVASAFAAASTVVDVSVELVAQLGYTLVGLLLLWSVRPESALLVPVLAGVCVMALLVSIFVAVQARGAAFVERALARAARNWMGPGAGAGGAVPALIHKIHDRRGILIAAAATHFGAWLLNGVEAWLTLLLMGVRIGLLEAMVIDSLLYGIRSAVFFIPHAIGIQEGGYVMLGALFGVAPDASLALSLIRRGRDLVIGAPTLLVWQFLEGRRAWATTIEPEEARRPS